MGRSEASSLLDIISVVGCKVGATIAEGKAKTFRIDSIFRWWSKCISATICRTASRNTLFSSARIIKTINVDRRPISSNADYQEDDLCLSVGDEFQDLLNNSDLLMSKTNQDIIQVQCLSTIQD